MAYILIHHKIENYNKWKPAFDAQQSQRADIGSMGGKIFRNAGVVGIPEIYFLDEIAETSK